MRELHEILASPHFNSSKRYPALLQFIVENTLAGKSELLKERTIGVDVFERQPTYDTSADTIVRFTAGEVRKRLERYYHEQGNASKLRISLPAGSYVPEFLCEYDEQAEEETESKQPVDAHHGGAGPVVVGGSAVISPASTSTPIASSSPIATMTMTETRSAPNALKGVSKWLFMASFALVVLLSILAGVKRIYLTNHTQTAGDDFWRPILHNHETVLICAGGADISPADPLGVKSASKDTEYPLVTLQTAASISVLSSLVQRGGETAQLRFAPSTPLTELSEHSLILLTAYNNPWTMRFVEPLRFHFSPIPDYAILDRTQNKIHWSRDPQVPYSNADDYAIVARFWNRPTDSWVVVLAGLGRNGMEAAALFVASPHYMQLLRDQIGRDFSDHNIEAVLKVGVIDGKTGSPSIVAVHVW